jgi:lipopolysaccharide export system protein LptA
MGQWDGGIYKNLNDSDDSRAAMQDSHFSNSKYFLTTDNLRSMKLVSKEFMFNASLQKNYAVELKGSIFTSGNEEIFYEGDKGVFDEKLEKLTLDGNVQMESGGTKGTSDKMDYYSALSYAELFGSVKTSSFYVEQKDYIEVEGDYAKVFTEKEISQFRGHVKGKVRRAKRYEESLYFFTNVLDMNLASGKMSLTGNVSIKKQLLTAKSRRGEIFLQNYNKKLKYFVLYDDVKVVEQVLLSGQTPMKRRSYSEKLEGLMTQSKAVLTGYPKVYQQNDVIKGSKIILRENTEVIEVIDANTNILIKE